MPARSLPLLERIVAALAGAVAPVPGEVLARDFLGIHWIDRARADRLLAPTLEADPRIARTAFGWTLRDGVTTPPARRVPLDAPGVALFAPRQPEVAAAVPFGDGPPRLVVALGGQCERERVAVRGIASPDGPLVDLGRVVRLVHRVAVPPDPPALAETLGVPHVEQDTPHGRARVVAAIWHQVAGDLREEGIDDLPGLDGLLEARVEAVDFSGREFGAEDLEVLPESPGTYLFEDGAGRALYAGQSCCLRRRVTSYFCGPPRDEKDRAIRREARRLRARATDTALDAWIAEIALIRRLRPRLNCRQEVRKAPGAEDGILLVRGPGRFVAFVVTGGRLAGRFATGGGAGRVRRLARQALRALDVPGRNAGTPAARRAAALVAAWRRVHPGAPWLTPALTGPPHDIEAAIVSTAQEWGFLSPEGDQGFQR